jgi:hypothetical protein
MCNWPAGRLPEGNSCADQLGDSVPKAGTGFDVTLMHRQRVELNPSACLVTKVTSERAIGTNNPPFVLM